MLLALLLILTSIVLMLGANWFLHRWPALSIGKSLLIFAVASAPAFLGGFLLFARHIVVAHG
ncbi:hypothetical protein FHS91_003692 [Sphingobium xanthum]|uniref:hypothetical protein n=1 Tax=Sphingobium xanthum TaxID=1387165 RepID=UPI001C8C8F80|nr:hypothetical protein [Sphingobium xanthum]